MNNDFCRDIDQIFDLYIQKSSYYLNQKNDPEIGSQASNELSKKIYKNYVGSAFAMGIILREIAADSLFGIQRVLHEPIMSYAPFILFRGLVETSALSLWLTSTTISHEERTERFFIYRNDSLIQQIKYFNSVNDIENVKRIQQKITDYLEKAKKIGISIRYRNDGCVDGLTNAIPTTTELVKNMLDMESTYRLFSAIAHGKHWAIINSSFRKAKLGIEIFDGVKGGLLEKDIDPIGIIYLCLFSIKTLSKIEIEQFKLYGWDEQPLRNLENEIIMKLKDLTKMYNIPIASF